MVDRGYINNNNNLFVLLQFNRDKKMKMILEYFIISSVFIKEESYRLHFNNAGQTELLSCIGIIPKRFF